VISPLPYSNPQQALYKISSFRWHRLRRCRLSHVSGSLSACRQTPRVLILTSVRHLLQVAVLFCCFSGLNLTPQTMVTISYSVRSHLLISSSLTLPSHFAIAALMLPTRSHGLIRSQPTGSRTSHSTAVPRSLVLNPHLFQSFFLTRMTRL
jgi:hypothetical protein